MESVTSSDSAQLVICGDFLLISDFEKSLPKIDLFKCYYLVSNVQN